MVKKSFSKNIKSTTLPPKKHYEPDKGKFVKSKGEYIIYTHLKDAKERGIINDFNYEEVLTLKDKSFNFKPDFTIYLPNNKIYYWEHLGMLDTSYYTKNWAERKRIYEDEGHLDNLITSDDLKGIKKEIVIKMIEDIRKENLTETSGNNFSNHHYCLY